MNLEVMSKAVHPSALAFSEGIDFSFKSSFIVVLLRLVPQSGRTFHPDSFSFLLFLGICQAPLT